MADGIRIDQLDPTLNPSRLHYVAAMKDGLSVKLSVGQIIDLLVGAAPGQLDTLDELAAALGDDPNFAATTAASIAAKLDKAGGTMTGQLTFNKTLSAGNKLVDLQQGYSIWSDNTGFFGTSRAWIETPATGEVIFGPRSGVGFQLLRARALRVEFPEATTFTIGGNEVYHAGNDDDLAKLVGDQTFTGIAKFNGGIYTYGHTGDAAKGILRFNSTGTAYQLFDGSKFLFTNSLDITGSVIASSGITSTAGSMSLAEDAYFFSYKGGASGNVRAGIKAIGSTQTLEFWAGSAARGGISSSGNLAVQGVYNLTTAAAANVNVDTVGTFARSTSSLKYKKGVVTYDLGIEKLMKLRPVLYQSKIESDGDRYYAGFIAEEVHAAGLSEFVVYDEEGEPDALHYGQMTALLAKALQEAVSKIEALEARVAALEGA